MVSFQQPYGGSDLVPEGRAFFVSGWRLAKSKSGLNEHAQRCHVLLTGPICRHRTMASGKWLGKLNSKQWQEWYSPHRDMMLPLSS